jgi:hypothetical protein
MRRTLLGGLLLVAAAFFLVLVGGWLDLELDSVALLGLTAGAVVALVPDATLGRRILGFGLGVVVTVLGYMFRAQFTPDTSMGRAVFAGVVVALCVVVALVAVGRLPLWSVLLGASSFAGAFEATYNTAVPRVVPLSIGVLTELALCVVVGFVVAAFFAADRPERHTHRAGDETTADDTDEQRMEPAQ